MYSHFVLRESVQSLCPERVCTVSHFVLTESVQSLCPKRVCTVTLSWESLYSHFVLRESAAQSLRYTVCYADLPLTQIAVVDMVACSVPAVYVSDRPSETILYAENLK